MKNKNGFTLVEVLLYIAIVIIFLGGAVSIGWSIIFGSIKNNVQKEVTDNLLVFEKKLRYEVMNASLITVSSTSLNITPRDTSRGNILFELDNQRIMYGEGDSGGCSILNPCSLTGSNVLVTNLAFEDLSNPLIDTKIVGYSITIKYDTSSNKTEWNYENSLNSSIETRGL